MIEGDLVTIVGKFDSRVSDKSKEPRTGTFWINVTDKKVLVLLPNGNIYYGHAYDVIPYQKEIE